MGTGDRTYPKGVWFQPKTLRSGERVHYGYFGRGAGMLALGRRGTPEFYTSLAEAMRKEPPGGNLDHLIWDYRKTALPQLRDRTQADYRLRLDKIQAKFGGLSLRAMASDAIASHIIAWRDEAAGSP